MGKGSERIAASFSGGGEKNPLGSCEAHDVGGNPEEDRGVPAGTMGEVESGTDEGSLERGHKRPATMGLAFTADGQTTTSTTLVVNGWVTLTNPTNLIYVGCSVSGPWDTTTLHTQVQTLTAVQSTVVESAGSAY